MALVLKSLFGVKLLFDLRGVMAEEYVDAGLWREGSIPFRLVKWVEAKTFRRADAIVMLTHRIKDILQRQSRDLQANPMQIEVIPTCVDLPKYAHYNRVARRRELGLDEKLVMAYCGSLGGWYLSEEMVQLFATGRSTIERFHFLILTQSRHALITNALDRIGIPAESYTIKTVTPDEIPSWLPAADFGLSFIKPCFSKLSSSPTKIGEYLASGLPLLTNTGIGDLDSLVRDESVGVLVESFTVAAYTSALANMLELISNGEAIRQRCREVAERQFSLQNIGRERYLRVYERLGFTRSLS
jgi:glycosyltransferase involved in cell wall biosynthesis